MKKKTKTTKEEARRRGSKGIERDISRNEREAAKETKRDQEKDCLRNKTHVRADWNEALKI